jgi:hypothetical protein
VALSAGGEACGSIAASAVRNQSPASQGRSDRVQGREEDFRFGTSETTIRSSEVHAIGFKRPETTKRGLSNVVKIVAAEKRIKAKTGLFGGTLRVSLNRPEEQGRAAHVDQR